MTKFTLQAALEALDRAILSERRYYGTEEHDERILRDLRERLASGVNGWYRLESREYTTASIMKAYQKYYRPVLIINVDSEER